MTPNHPAGLVHYPVVGLSHLCDDPVGLIAHLLPGASRITLCVALQPNSVPHLGTVTTLMTTFALAARAAETFKLPTDVTIDLLENSPYWQSQEHDTAGNAFVLSLAAAQVDGAPVLPLLLEAVRPVWERLSRDTQIPMRLRHYDEFQRHPSVRQTIATAVERAHRIGPIVSPVDHRLHLRPECPACRRIAKTPQMTHVSLDAGGIVLQSACSEHGTYQVAVGEDGAGWVDMNTALRDLAKGVMLNEAWRDARVFPLTVSGADWSGMWPLRLFAEGMSALGVPYGGIPQRYYAPTILDWSGAKLSKSLYVVEGAYRGDEAAFVDLEQFSKRFGERGYEALWSEVRTWVTSNARLMRSYTVDYLRTIVDTER